MKKIILDTDIGSDVDDALCLGLALAEPAVELVGMTTVAGDTACRARIARKLARLAGHPEIPVFAGAVDPVDDEKRFFWHGQEGDGILDESDNDPLPEENAGAALARMIQAHPEAEVVAVGPLTNLARLILEEPGIAAQIPQLTIMGGHLREIRFGDRGFPFGIDYNICSDPAAATYSRPIYRHGWLPPTSPCEPGLHRKIVTVWQKVPGLRARRSCEPWTAGHPSSGRSSSNSWATFPTMLRFYTIRSRWLVPWTNRIAPSRIWGFAPAGMGMSFVPLRIPQAGKYAALRQSTGRSLRHHLSRRSALSEAAASTAGLSSNAKARSSPAWSPRRTRISPT